MSQFSAGSEIALAANFIRLSGRQTGCSPAFRKNLNFKSGKYDIEKQYFNDLEKLVDLLNDEKDIKIEIAGHTDSIGIDQANQILSENRAKSVKSFLVRNKINHNRITCVGYGEKQPISTNSTSEGRKKNRRIEIRILK